MKIQLSDCKVLIVDDEPDLRKTLIRVLQSLNIQTMEAENGKYALEMLRDQKFHAVLCDIKMPEMTGLECLAHAQVEGIVSPFVFLTGYADSHHMLQAIRLGALDFIPKPFENLEVLNVLLRALEVGSRRIHLLETLEAGNLRD